MVLHLQSLSVGGGTNASRFVISLIFSYFAIPPKYQYRALLWGIIAVIVLRGLIIAGGAALVNEAYWILYIFAAFLVFTGVKMFFVVRPFRQSICRPR